MSNKKWKEIMNGWGLVEVPPEIKEEVICCMCQRSGNWKLYTNQLNESYKQETNLTRYGIAFNEAIDRIRNHTYCRDHAEQCFND